MSLQEKRERYAALCHAMQTGVAYKMQKDASETAPKHLRVGINSALVQDSALALLLMKKGIITEDEYFDAVNEAMEREVKGYQEELRRLYGADITLG